MLRITTGRFGRTLRRCAGGEMRSNHRGGFLMQRACWLAVAATAACFAGDPGINPNQECNDAIGMPCPMGEVCLEHVCHELCDHSRDCDEPNEACSQPDGLCVQYADTCDEDHPCVEGFYCGEFDGVCRKYPEFVDCENLVMDGGETDIDCGGPYCEGCDPGDGCGAHTDCESRVCSPSTNTCEAPACDDDVENGDESDVDCGGPSMVCPRCSSGAECYGAADCDSKVCTQEVCQAATCTDGVLNGTESDTDCGIGCPLCADGRPCNSADDCTNGVCDEVCQVPACDDGVANGTETDIDCGGPCPVRCPDNAGCDSPADCVSGVCTDDVCQAPTCVDDVQNGDEADIDCGGQSLLCPRCETGAACELPADCVSGVCGVMGCVAPNCDDGVHNGDESDIDCGGPCDPCPDGATCSTHADCQSARCGNHVCLFELAVFGTPSTERVSDMAWRAPGELALVGTYKTSIDFGGGPLPETVDSYYGVLRNSFWATFTPALVHTGSSAVSWPPRNWIAASAVDPATGDLIVVGESTGRPTLWDSPWGSMGVERLSPGGWTALYATGRAMDVIATQTGSIAVAGIFRSSLNFRNGTTIWAPISAVGGFAAVFSTDGAVEWVFSAVPETVEGSVVFNCVAAAPEGSLYIGGYYSGTVQFGDQTETSETAEGFVTKLSPSIQSHVWTSTIDERRVYACGADSSGSILAGGPLFLAKLDSDGNEVWSNSFASEEGTVSSLAIGTNDRALIGGTFRPTIDLATIPSRQQVPVTRTSRSSLTTVTTLRPPLSAAQVQTARMQCLCTQGEWSPWPVRSRTRSTSGRDQSSVWGWMTFSSTTGSHDRRNPQPKRAAGPRGANRSPGYGSGVTSVTRDGNVSQPVSVS